MDLTTHYESYRASVNRDALEGFAEFAQKSPTLNPQQYATVHDYLRSTVGGIQNAIRTNDRITYRIQLKNHQEAMIALFEKMVADLTKPTPEETLTTLLDKGWKWLKFSKSVVHFTNHVWIPRYAIAFQGVVSSGKPVFCADEVALFLKMKPAKVIMNGIIEEKKRRPHYVTNLTTSGSIEAFDVPVVNNGPVRDWTQELFP